MTHHTRRVLEQFALAAGWSLAAIGWTVAALLAWYFSTEPAMSATPRHGLHSEMPARPQQTPRSERKTLIEYPCSGRTVFASPAPSGGFILTGAPGPEEPDCRPVRIAEPGTVLLVLGGLVVMGRWV